MRMMEKKRMPLLHPLLLLMGFTFLLSLGISASGNQKPTVFSITDLQGVFGELEVEEVFLHGRMVIERNDYPGSGANNRHDPRTPKRG